MQTSQLEKKNKLKKPKERYPQAETQPGVCLHAVHKQPETCCYRFRDLNQFQVIKGPKIYPGGAVSQELQSSPCPCVIPTSSVQAEGEDTHNKNGLT